MRSLCIAIILACAMGSAAFAGVRVALISTGPEKQTSSLMALAEAKLSADSRLELLDRTSIRRVLEEQKLSLAGLVDAEHAVAAGKLLRVEMFAFVQSLDDENPPVLTVFDAFNGARLVDVDLPAAAGGGEAQADAIAAGVDRARSKLVAPLHAKTICLLAVRNADLPRKSDGMCTAVAMLLERRLLDSNDVRLLERKRLEGINRERQLGTLDPKHDILASVVCVELEFARGSAEAGGKPMVTALLTDAAGKPLADPQGNALAKPTSPVDEANIAEAVNQLATKIAVAIQIAPAQAAALDPQKEARRFFSEARFLLGHAQVADGLAAAESAYALSPDMRESAKLLSFALLRRANEMMRHKEDDAKALELATRAMEIRDACIMNLRRTDPTDRELSIYPDNLTGDWVMALLAHAQQTPGSRELGEAYVKFAHDWITSSESLAAGNELALAHHMEYIRLNRVVDCLALASGTMSQYVEEVCGIYARYFDLLARLKPESSLRPYLNAGRDLNDVSYWSVRERQWTPKDFKGGDLQRIEHLYQALADNASPAVQFYGLRDRLQFARAAGRVTAAGDAAACADARDAGRKSLDDPTLLAIDRTGFQRNLLIWSAMSMIDRRQPAQQRLADRLEWYDFLIRRRQIPQLAIVHLPDLQMMKASPEETIALLKRVRDTIDDPATTLIGCSHAEAAAQLADRIHKLADAYPDVRTAFLGAGGGVRSLLGVGGDVAAIDQVVADQHSAYAVVSATDEGGQPVLRAMSLPSGNGAGEARSIGSVPGPMEVNDACLTDQWIIAATDHGIVLFARDGGKPSRITSDDGLPTDIVQSVAMLGDVIYAGLGDRGYLVAYDLAARKCDVLASSRRKRKLSPFDDSGGFSIVRIVADEAKDRILFVHCHAGRYAENGLWQLDPRSNQFTQLLKVYFDYGDRNAAASRMLPDGRMMINSYNWAAAFDTRDDSTKVLFSDSIGIGPDHREKDLPFEFNKHLAAPFTLVGEELWAGSPFSRVTPRTNHVTPIDFPAQPAPQRPNRRWQRPARGVLTTRAARDLEQLEPNQCSWIEPLPDERHVIAGNARGLWLVDISVAAPATQPATQPAKADADRQKR